MDIFEHLIKIDETMEEKQEALDREKLFGLSKKGEMNFLVEDLAWDVSNHVTQEEKPKVKIAPLSSGFGPWTW